MRELARERVNMQDGDRKKYLKTTTAILKYSVTITQLRHNLQFFKSLGIFLQNVGTF